MGNLRLLRVMVTFLVVLVFSVSVAADFTIDRKVAFTIYGGKMKFNGRSTDYVSGDKETIFEDVKVIREDVPTYVKSSLIFRFDKKSVWHLNHDQQTYTVMPFVKWQTQSKFNWMMMGLTFDYQDPVMSNELIRDEPLYKVVKSGRKKKIKNLTCDEIIFTMVIQLKSKEKADTGSYILEMKFWTTKEWKGQKEYEAQVIREREMGHDLAASMVAVLPEAGIDRNKFMAKMAEVEGLPLKIEGTTTTTGDFKGYGGGEKISIEVKSLSTESIDQDVFEIPEDYRKVRISH